MENLRPAGLQSRYLYAIIIQRQISALYPIAGINLGNFAVPGVLHRKDFISPQQLNQQPI